MFQYKLYINNIHCETHETNVIRLSKFYLQKFCHHLALVARQKSSVTHTPLPPKNSKNTKRNFLTQSILPERIPQLFQKFYRTAVQRYCKICKERCFQIKADSFLPCHLLYLGVTSDPLKVTLFQRSRVTYGLSKLSQCSSQAILAVILTNFFCSLEICVRMSVKKDIRS